jgi:crossover junction endodeoxyribonuclease RuvC
VTPAHILGIDPGLSGGWSLIGGDGKLLSCGSFPTHTVKKSGKASTQLDGVALALLLRPLAPTHAFVEVVSSRPRQAGQFQFGINCGLVHGILHAHGIQFELVAPASWKAAFGIKRAEDETKRDKKNEARQMAIDLYPSHADKFSRVKDDGVAEATLIALYGLYQLSQR